MRARALIVALVTAVFAACASDPAAPAPPTDGGADAGAIDGGGCPSDLPAACPTPTPSWAADVAPIVTSRCYPCHAPGGIAAAKHELSSYDRVFAQRSAVLNQVYACAMPPKDAPALTPVERQKLLGWLVCKAPNN